MGFLPPWVSPEDLRHAEERVVSRLEMLLDRRLTVHQRAIIAHLESLGISMDQFEGSVEELKSAIDEVTNGWADKLAAAQADNAALLNRIAEMEATDADEDLQQLAAQAASHAAVIDELVRKLRGTGNGDVPVDQEPLPEPVPTDPGDVTAPEEGDHSGDVPADGADTGVDTGVDTGESDVPVDPTEDAGDAGADAGDVPVDDQPGVIDETSGEGVPVDQVDETHGSADEDNEDDVRFE